MVTARVGLVLGLCAILAVGLEAGGWASGDDPISSSRERVTVDGQYGLIAERVPGFAGLHFDGDVLVINVTEDGVDAGEPARAAAAEILDREDLLTAKLRVEEVPFSWTQLLGWYRAMHNDVWQVDGVTTTDIDESDNVITVGVSNIGKAERDVRDVATAWDVPREALEIVELEAVRPEAETEINGRVGSGLTAGPLLALLLPALVWAGVATASRAKRGRSLGAPNR